MNREEACALLNECIIDVDSKVPFKSGDSFAQGALHVALVYTLMQARLSPSSSPTRPEPEPEPTPESGTYSDHADLEVQTILSKAHPERWRRPSYVPEGTPWTMTVLDRKYVGVWLSWIPADDHPLACVNIYKPSDPRNPMGFTDPEWVKRSKACGEAILREDILRFGRKYAGWK